MQKKSAKQTHQTKNTRMKRCNGKHQQTATAERDERRKISQTTCNYKIAVQPNGGFALPILWRKKTRDGKGDGWLRESERSRQETTDNEFVHTVVRFCCCFCNCRWFNIVHICLLAQQKSKSQLEIFWGFVQIQIQLVQKKIHYARSSIWLEVG